MSSFTSGLIVGNLFVAFMAALGWTLALTVAPGAITMALGATIVAVPAVALLIFSLVMDRR